MASGIGLVIKIAAETTKAAGDIKGINKALEGTGTQASTTGGLFKKMQVPAMAALGAVAGIAGAAATAMVQFGQAAIEDQQEAKKLARVLGTLPGVTQDMIDANEDWITSTMFATNVVDTELREAVGQLALITGDLATAQDYAAKAADLATVANVEYSVAAEAVERALAGKTRQLQALAPWLDTNKDGILDTAEASAILTDKTLEGQAAAAAAEDPWTTMGIIWDEIKESLGQWILPLFDRFAKWFKDPQNQAKIQAFIDKLGDMSAELGEDLLPLLDRFLDYLGSDQAKADMRTFGEALKVVADAIIGMADAFRDLKNAYDRLPQWVKDFLKRPFPLAPPTPWDRPGTSGAAPSSATLFGPSTAATTTSTRNRSGGVVINFNGTVTDPESTARAIRRVLDQSQRRNGLTAASW